MRGENGKSYTSIVKVFFSFLFILFTHLQFFPFSSFFLLDEKEGKEKMVKIRLIAFSSLLFMERGKKGREADGMDERRDEELRECTCY